MFAYVYLFLIVTSNHEELPMHYPFNYNVLQISWIILLKSALSGCSFFFWVEIILAQLLLFLLPIHLLIGRNSHLSLHSSLKFFFLNFGKKQMQDLEAHSSLLLWVLPKYSSFFFNSHLYHLTFYGLNIWSVIFLSV